jgi:hypothetical protein
MVTPNGPGGLKAQYLAPSVIGGVVAFLVSTGFNIWNAIDKSNQEAQAQAQTFSKILTDTVLTNTKPFAKNSTIYDEQQATVALMALDGLATTEPERRTVLYIGARLLTASNTRADTGGPGARFLDVSIGRILDDPDLRDSTQNQDLLSLVRSSGFVDLATAGYSTQYYNDNPSIRELQPTLDGDQPITQGAKLSLLVDIGPSQPKAWIHLASWRTSLHFTRWESANIPDITKNFKETATTQFNDYAKPVYSDLETRSPTRLGDWLAFTNQTLILTRPRLARASQPIVNYAGAMRTGTLGRVIGAIPALTCVDLVEPPVPVIVFVESSRLANRDAVGFDGLIHLWGHVQTRSNCP